MTADPNANLPGNEFSSAVTRGGASIGNSADVQLAKSLVLQGRPIERAASRAAKNEEIAMVIAELRAARQSLAEGYVRRARKHARPSEAILAILRDSALSIGRTQFAVPEIANRMKAKLELMVQRGQPIVLPLLMGGGKAPNALKVGGCYLPDLADWTAWSTLEAIGAAITEVYRPGASLIVVPDAALHTADIGMPIETTLAYASLVKSDLARLGLDHVAVPDVINFLNSEWVNGVQRLVVEARQRFDRDAAFATDVHQQIESLVYSLNTRVFGNSFERDLLVYAAVSGHIEGLPNGIAHEAQQLRQRSADIAFHYVAVNWAIRQLELVEAIVLDRTGYRDHLRLSVHAKPGEPRPKLFASSSHFPSIEGLLPMHSVGVRLKGLDKVRYGAAFELSGRLRGWTPVHDSKDERFLWFDAAVSST